MQAAGATRIVALVKEDVGTQVKEFRDGFWGGEVFMDKEMEFYKALGGGQMNRPFSGVAALLAAVMNPFNKGRFKANMARNKKKNIANNLVGEGFITGGVYVIRKDGSAAYSFLEAELGDHAPVEDVIAAVRAAAAA
mmetsp:Transcript_58813/g.127237  ORF Transcript_58813/g.127237 Transcript_58813/m.127237 type:complete len:137 (-) Transcript_58813:124-534(-)